MPNGLKEFTQAMQGSRQGVQGGFAALLQALAAGGQRAQVPQPVPPTPAPQGQPDFMRFLQEKKLQELGGKQAMERTRLQEEAGTKRQGMADRGALRVAEQQGQNTLARLNSEERIQIEEEKRSLPFKAARLDIEETLAARRAQAATEGPRQERTIEWHIQNFIQGNITERQMEDGIQASYSRLPPRSVTEVLREKFSEYGIALPEGEDDDPGRPRAYSAPRDVDRAIDPDTGLPRARYETFMLGSELKAEQQLLLTLAGREADAENSLGRYATRQGQKAAQDIARARAGGQGRKKLNTLFKALTKKHDEFSELQDQSKTALETQSLEDVVPEQLMFHAALMAHKLRGTRGVKGPTIAWMGARKLVDLDYEPYDLDTNTATAVREALNLNEWFMAKEQTYQGRGDQGVPDVAAHVNYLYIKELREAMTFGGDAYAAFVKTGRMGATLEDVKKTSRLTYPDFRAFLRKQGSPLADETDETLREVLASSEMRNVLKAFRVEIFFKYESPLEGRPGVMALEALDLRKQQIDRYTTRMANGQPVDQAIVAGVLETNAIDEAERGPLNEVNRVERRELAPPLLGPFDITPGIGAEQPATVVPPRPGQERVSRRGLGLSPGESRGATPPFGSREYYDWLHQQGK